MTAVLEAPALGKKVPKGRESDYVPIGFRVEITKKGGRWYGKAGHGGIDVTAESGGFGGVLGSLLRQWLRLNGYVLKDNRN